MTETDLHRWEDDGGAIPAPPHPTHSCPSCALPLTSRTECVNAQAQTGVAWLTVPAFYTRTVRSCPQCNYQRREDNHKGRKAAYRAARDRFWQARLAGVVSADDLVWLRTHIRAVAERCAELEAGGDSASACVRDQAARAFAAWLLEGA